MPGISGTGRGSGLAFGYALRVALCALPGAAVAEVKEYQIRRMLLLRTECGVSGLDASRIAHDAASAGSGGLRFTDLFRATCENVAHYPDGVEIACPDTEDEHDCRLLTRKREFPHLKPFGR